jgi:hypothetical protein
MGLQGFDSEQRNEPHRGAHLERQVAAIGQVELVVEESVFVVPYAMADLVCKCFSLLIPEVAHLSVPHGAF